jgi:hypothetical protein
MRALQTKCDRLHGKGTNALAPTVYIPCNYTPKWYNVEALY